MKVTFFFLVLWGTFIVLSLTLSENGGGQLACTSSVAVLTQVSHPCSQSYPEYDSPFSSLAPLPFFLNLLSVYILICAPEILTLS